MIVLLVFLVVYAGMFFGRLPGLQLDRTGFALLGAIILVVTGELSLTAAEHAVDLPTLILLFSLMVVSAQLRLGGFYTRVAEALANLPLSAPRLLGALVLAAGGLAAVFSNDIICLAMAPVLIHACRRRHLDPVPFLLALACAANIGSAATLIGNPQNMLIGQVLALSFCGYLLAALPAVLAGLAVTWGVIFWQYRSAWSLVAESDREPVERYPFDRWQTGKGLTITAALLVIFLAAPWPRETTALAAAGVLLLSRQMHSRHMLGLVDWPLLVLFVGLFAVNAALLATGVPERLVAALSAHGVALASPAWLFSVSTLLSNAVSNVPATMLLLPIATDAHSGLILALSSTLAGNLLIVGSIANIIVVDAAGREGVVIDWRQHARTGVPVTVLSLALTALTLVLLGG